MSNLIMTLIQGKFIIMMLLLIHACFELLARSNWSTRQSVSRISCLIFYFFLIDIKISAADSLTLSRWGSCFSNFFCISAVSEIRSFRSLNIFICVWWWSWEDMWPVCHVPMCPDFLLRLLCENLNIIPQNLERKMKMKKVKVLSQAVYTKWFARIRE